MCAKASEVTEHVSVSYPKHQFDPVELLDFLRLDGFDRDWKRLRFDDLDFRILRALISLAPTRPPVISGTGGLRKVRFSAPKSHAGKRSGARVCYAYFGAFGIVLLVHAYAKSTKDDLSEREKKQIRTLLRAFERSLAKGPLH